jgi:hypothetical protein
VDLVTGGEGVEVLGLVQVPKHGGSVLATGSAERTIGGDGDGVDVAGVADVVGLDAAGSEFPNLDDVSLCAIILLQQVKAGYVISVFGVVVS